MPISRPLPRTLVRDAVVGGGDALSGDVLPTIAVLRSATDADLLERFHRAEAAVRRAAMVKAAIAGEIARRSSVSAGHAGLAARFGERTPERLVARLTGVTAGEARQLTATGSLLQAVETGETPWLAPVAEAVVRGELTVGAAAAVARGVGERIDGVEDAVLAETTTALVDFARVATPEETAARAREVRDELHEEGVLDRERAVRARRSLTWKALDDGSTRMVGVFDPESWARFSPVLEAGVAVASTRTEVRFMSTAEREAVAASGPVGEAAPAGVGPRTLDQARLDALVDVAELAGRAAASELDPQRILGDRSTGVRVHVQAADLASGTGFGRFEGQTAAVSIETITRLVCTSGILPVLLDGLTPIDAGRTQRLHSNRQRIAIAAAWGGCAWTGCDRPEHACEVHHREAWNGSNTTLGNGIPLCRFHHMELHANGWTLSVDADGTTWLDPPPGHPRLERRALRPRPVRPRATRRTGA